MAELASPAGEEGVQEGIRKVTEAADALRSVADGLASRLFDAIA